MPHGLMSLDEDMPYQILMRRRNASTSARIWLRWFLQRQSSVRIFIFCIFACILVYVAVFLYVTIFTSNIVIDDTMVTAVPEHVLREHNDFKETIIDRVCSQKTSRCYTIKDAKSVDDPNFVERHLIVDGFDEESDSIVRLIPPQGATFESSDTRIWQVNHRYLITEYIYCLAIAPFLVFSLSETESNANKHILEVGLGGGTLDGFLHVHFPQMHISAVELDPSIVEVSEKWFDVRNDSSRQTIVDDGIQFIKQASRKGQSYDVIFLDACDLDTHFPCPAADFRQPEIIELMKNILTNKGTLVINVLPMEENQSRLEETLKVFTDIFPSCLKFRMTKEVNIVLACTKFIVNDPNSMLRLYAQRASKLAHLLQVPHLADTVALASSSS